MSKLQIASLVLLFVSLLFNWGTGYEGPFLLQIVYPSGYDSAGLLNNALSVLGVLGVLIVFIILILLALNSAKSRNVSLIGLVLSIGLTIFILLMALATQQLSGFPTEPAKDLTALGFGPLVAVIATSLLSFSLFKNLRKVK